MEYTCFHKELPADQQRSKRWLMVTSPSYKVLKSMMMDTRFLKDLQQMTLFKHTGMCVILMVNSDILKVMGETVNRIWSFPPHNNSTCIHHVFYTPLLIHNNSHGTVIVNHTSNCLFSTVNLGGKFLPLIKLIDPGVSLWINHLRKDKDFPEISGIITL